MATTRANLSPSFVLELLHRTSRIIKDYLGVLNEESLRRNFVLVYELLDEMFDFGYPQCTSTEALKAFVFNESAPLDMGLNLAGLAGPGSMFMPAAKRMPGSAITRSVVATDRSGKKREEIFVDIIERLNVTFSNTGNLLVSEVDGTIQVKSFLSGNPEIRVALNEDLVIGRQSLPPGFGPQFGGPDSGLVILDDCNFHESVRMDDFDIDRTLTLVPPDGEFSLMNYRMTSEFKPPFRVYPMVDESSPFKAEVTVKLRSDYPSTVTANTVCLRIPLPKSVVKVSCDLDPGQVGQSTDFKESPKVLEWHIKKMAGGLEHVLRAKLTLNQERAGNMKKETGPINLTFNIPMYNSSRLQVRYLQIMKASKAYSPFRWVRYVTHANSYVVRT